MKSLLGRVPVLAFDSPASATCTSRSAEWSRTALLSAILLCTGSSELAAQNQIVGWGGTVFNSSWNAGPFVQISAAESHTTALRADGTAVAVRVAG